MTDDEKKYAWKFLKSLDDEQLKHYYEIHLFEKGREHAWTRLFELEFWIRRKLG